MRSLTSGPVPLSVPFVFARPSITSTLAIFLCLLLLFTQAAENLFEAAASSLL
jgi:hypothetical protein